LNTATGLRRGLAALTVAAVLTGAGSLPVCAAVRTGGGGAAVIGGAQLGGPGVAVNYPPGRPPKLPGVKASSWVIADAGTGQVLAAKDPHGYYRPASTLKVLTAVALIPALNPSATVVASKLATSQVPNDIGLLTGHPYKVSDLFTALLTISANDAAVALAEGTGSYDRGMALINAEAHHLQADDTVAMDPNGLDSPGQRTSAYDLALIARQALTMPAFMRYDTTTGGLFPIKSHKSVGLWNQNGLLTGYRGGIGGKIGWTSAAGATYVGMARRGGQTLIVSLLHCPALTEITSAEKLLDWGFAQDGKVKPVGTLVAPLSAAAADGTAGPSAPGRQQDRRVSAAKESGIPNPAVVAAIGVSIVTVLAAGIAFAYSRRNHSPR